MAVWEVGGSYESYYVVLTLILCVNHDLDVRMSKCVFLHLLETTNQT